MEMGQWVMVTASGPLTQDEITAQILNTITRLPTFVFLYDWPLFSVLCS